MDGSVLFGLTTGQEGDAGHCGGHSPREGGDGGNGHLLRSEFLSALLASSDHVRLEQRALQVHVVVAQGLVHERQHGLRHLLSAIQVVFTIGKNLKPQYKIVDAIRLALLNSYQKAPDNVATVNIV